MISLFPVKTERIIKLLSMYTQLVHNTYIMTSDSKTLIDYVGSRIFKFKVLGAPAFKSQPSTYDVDTQQHY